MTRTMPPNVELEMDSSASKLEGVFHGQEAISFLKENLGVREAMIAAMLDVTTRTLDNWKRDNLFQGSGKVLRLRAFYEAVCTMQAAAAGISGPSIINLLNAPIVELEGNETCSSLLHVIVETPDNKLIMPLVKRIAKEYV